MLSIAGQTAGLIGLTFFVDTHGWPGGVNQFFQTFFFQTFFKFCYPQATPSTTAWVS